MRTSLVVGRSLRVCAPALLVLGSCTFDYGALHGKGSLRDADTESGVPSGGGGAGVPGGAGGNGASDGQLASGGSAGSDAPFGTGGSGGVGSPEDGGGMGASDGSLASGGSPGSDGPVATDGPVLDGRGSDGADTKVSNPDTYVTTDTPPDKPLDKPSDGPSDGRVEPDLPSPDVPDTGKDTGPSPDVTPPDTTLTSTPPALTNTATPTFTFSSTESGTFECQMDTALATVCSSPYTAAPLSEGRHVFSVTAIDLAGNRDPSPATFAFTVDVTPPETYLRGWPLPTTGKYAAFAFTSPDTKAGFECSLDSPDVWESCTSPKQYVLTSDGSHTFLVRAVDMAGNKDASPAAATFTTSLVLPTAFPDSSTIFCTNGATKVDCPLAAASGWGQDGTYLINTPRYTPGVGTVTDALTGLTWEQGNAPNGTWDTQVARCTSLSTDGYVDWRLPSRLEVLTLIDAGRVQPALDVTAFATTSPSSSFWLGQELDGVPTAAWFLNWVDASLSWNGKTAQYSAKCVRGSGLSGTLTASASGLVVNDSRTNLTWQRTVSGSTYAWLDALAYCNDLALDSATDWRLPTVKELQTLINVGAGLNPPSIPTVFPAGNEVEMWSSSPNPATPSSSYTVHMGNGAGASQPTSTLLQARCVR